MASNCKKCNSGSISSNNAYTYHDLHTCATCGYTWSTRLAECCRNPDLIIAMEGDGFPGSKLYYQCRNCGGGSKSKPLKWKTYSGQINGLFDQDRFDQWKQNRNEENQLIFEGNRESNFLISDWGKYQTYLLSREWKAKRLLVLERDKNLCQCCKLAPAEQVHHLTYERLYNEPLDDLLAVCIPCHRHIHHRDSVTHGRTDYPIPAGGQDPA